MRGVKSSTQRIKRQSAKIKAKNEEKCIFCYLLCLLFKSVEGVFKYVIGLQKQIETSGGRNKKMKRRKKDINITSNSERHVMCKKKGQARNLLRYRHGRRRDQNRRTPSLLSVCLSVCLSVSLNLCVSSRNRSIGESIPATTRVFKN